VLYETFLFLCVAPLNIPFKLYVVNSEDRNVLLWEGLILPTVSSACLPFYQTMSLLQLFLKKSRVIKQYSFVFVQTFIFSMINRM